MFPIPCYGLVVPSCFRERTLGIWCLLVLIYCGGVYASDPTPASYRSRYENQVHRTNIRPRWLPEDRGFWYRVRTGPRMHEFVLIDAKTGERTASENVIDLEISASSELRTSEVVQAAESKSVAGGIPCSLRFLNKTDAPVSLEWLNFQGQAVSHGDLQPDQEYRQRTYEGHLWRITDAQGNLLAKISAGLLQDTILIDGKSSSPISTSENRTGNRTAVGVSPDGQWRAEYRGQEMLITRLDTGEKNSLKAGLMPDSRFFGPISWSPQSEAFVVSAAVPVTTRKITILESSPQDQLQPKSREIDYAKPGDPLPQPQPILFRLAGEHFESSLIDSALFPNQYITQHFHRYRWSPDGREFYLDYNQRGHQCYRILAVDADTGTVRTVLEETSSTFIDYQKKTWRQWLQEDSQLLWLSERDGWCHLWRIDVPGDEPPLQLTSGEWVIHHVLHVDETKGIIWFTASGLRKGEDPYHLHLCRVNLDGSGFQQLTEADGYHEVELSPQKSCFLATWSRVNHPPVVELRSLKDGTLLCEVERADASQFLKAGGVWPEPFVAKGRDGKTNIFGVIYKPTNFQRSRRYPVVEQVYAGPHGAFTPKRFGTDWKRQDLADLGFIVVQIDGMGTNFRGKAFHDYCWKNLKDAGFPDRIQWIRFAATSRPWMDLSRVGIYGGSAGGQTAMRALLDHHDFYHVAVADCGCHDNRMDKIWWNEQWMGWPVDEAYLQSSNAEDAEKLQGQLLLIVGEQDTNVDPASTYQVVAALQRAGKPFQFMPILNAGHGAAETAYGSQLRQEFLIRHLQHPLQENPPEIAAE